MWKIDWGKQNYDKNNYDEYSGTQIYGDMPMVEMKNEWPPNLNIQNATTTTAEFSQAVGSEADVKSKLDILLLTMKLLNSQLGIDVFQGVRKMDFLTKVVFKKEFKNFLVNSGMQKDEVQQFMDGFYAEVENPTKPQVQPEPPHII